MECDDEYWEIDEHSHVTFNQPPGKPSRVTAFTAHLRLTEILVYSMRTLHSTRKSKTSQISDEEWQQRIVTEVDSAMNHWKDGLPNHRMCVLRKHVLRDFKDLQSNGTRNARIFGRLSRPQSSMRFSTNSKFKFIDLLYTKIPLFRSPPQLYAPMLPGHAHVYQRPKSRETPHSSPKVRSDHEYPIISTLANVRHADGRIYSGCYATFEPLDWKTNWCFCCARKGHGRY